MKTPSSKPSSISEENKTISTSRDSKRLGDNFGEYDRQLVKPIEHFDIELKVIYALRKKVDATNIADIAAHIIKKLGIKNELIANVENELISSFTFTTDNLLNVNSDLIEKIELELDFAIEALRK
jgi:hypothetical protein